MREFSGRQEGMGGGYGHQCGGTYGCGTRLEEESRLGEPLLGCGEVWHFDWRQIGLVREECRVPGRGMAAGEWLMEG